MSKKRGGILPALPTPFTENESVCLPQLAAFTEAMMAAQVDGFYICGGTSEMPMLFAEERMELLECVCNTVRAKEGGEDLQLIAHVGSVNLREAKKLAQHAADMRVNAISSVLPYYVSLSYSEIEYYYRALADACGLPVIIYNVPAAQTSQLNRAEFIKLMACAEIGGIKFTSTDFYTLETLHSHYPDKVIFNGLDQALLSGLSAGADGGIGTTYNAMPGKFTALYRSFRSGDLNTAYRYQHEINEVIHQMQKIGCMKAVKCVLKLQGFDFGNLLLPNTQITADDMELTEREILPLL